MSSWHPESTECLDFKEAEAKLRERREASDADPVLGKREIFGPLSHRPVKKKKVVAWA